MASFFIPDGYTVSATLNALPELGCEKIQFKYRPATGGETNAWLQDRMRGDGKQLSEANAAFLADHLVSWNLKHNGKEIPITKENCNRLHSVLINRFRDIISGFEKPDEVEGESVKSEAETVGN